jgi:hypothetical protein
MIYYFLSTSLNQSCAQLWQAYLQSQGAAAAAVAAAAAATAPADAAAAAAAATAPADAAAPATPAGLSFADSLKQGKKLLTPPPTGIKRKEGASPFEVQMAARRQVVEPDSDDEEAS